MNRVLGTVQTVRIIEALKLKALSYADVAAIGGVQLRTAMQHVNALRNEKMVRIAAWGQDVRGYPTVRLFRWGSEPDAARPPARDSNIRVRAHRARKKKEQ